MLPGVFVVVTHVGYVVLDRVKDTPHPDYCSHGKATCVACGHWVWLGNRTHDMVAGGHHRPLCLPCAKLYGRPENRIVHVADNKHTDGPHV